MTEDVRRHRAAHTDLPLPYDDLERRRRRGVEWCGIAVRAVAAAWVVTAGLVRPPAALPEHLLGLYLAAPWPAAVAFGVLALRRVDGRRYRLVSVTNLVIDTLAVVAVVFVESADRSVVVWPVLVVPIVLGAVRHELPGALGAWALTTAAGVTLYLASGSLYGFRIGAAILATGAVLHLTVAVLTGTQARGRRQHHHELTAIRAELRHRARHDPLTGLASRTTVEERLRTLLHTGAPVTVVALDLDGFKTVNEAFGHAAGDELLQVVAGRLRAEVRDDDLVARLGDDRFVVVLADPAEAHALQLADQIRFALVAPIALHGNSARIDGCVGVARAAGTDPETLLRIADAEVHRVRDLRREAERVDHASAGRPGGLVPYAAGRRA